MAKVGVLKRIVKDFGFIKLDGENRDIFVHKNEYPGPMAEGAKVRFDESEPNPAKGGKTEAVNVEVLDRADSSASTPAPADVSTPPTTRSSKKKVVEDVAPSFKFGDPEKLDAQILVPTWVEFKQKEVPVPNVVVSLSWMGADGVLHGVKPKKATTNADGRAYFPVFFPEGTVSATLIAKVGSHEYTQPWPQKTPKAKRTEEATAATATAASDVHEGIWTIDTNRPRDPDPTTGLFFLTVTVQKDGKSTNRQFFVSSTPVPVDTKQHTSSGLIPVTYFVSKTPGIYEVFVGFNGMYAKINLKLDNGIEAVVHLRK